MASISRRSVQFFTALLFVSCSALPTSPTESSRLRWLQLKGHFSPEAYEGVPRSGDILETHHQITQFFEGMTRGTVSREGPAYLRSAINGPNELLDPVDRPGLRFLKGYPPGKGPVAAWVSQDRGTASSFLSLTPEEVRGLWGVTFTTWSQEIAGRLRSVNPQATHIGLSGDACSAAVIRQLPEDLRSLSLESPGFSRMSGSSTRFKSLEFLSASSLEVDAQMLLSLPRLRYLVLQHCQISNADALGKLSDLRECDLSNSTGLERTDFVAHLSRLHTLDLSDTDVRTMPELNGAPALRVLSLEGAQVRSFPAAPQVRVLDVTRTPLAADPGGLKMLRDLNPDCSIRGSHIEMLRKALEGVDGIEVFPVSWSADKHIKPMHRSADPDEIRRLIEGIVVREDFKQSNHFCHGGPSFKFMRRGFVAVELTLDHGEILDWIGGEWEGDTPLVKSSAQFLCDWLAARGHDAPKKELEGRK